MASQRRGPKLALHVSDFVLGFGKHFLHRIMLLNQFFVPFYQSIKKVYTTDGAKRKPNIPGTGGNLGLLQMLMALPRPLCLKANELSKAN